MHNFILGGAFSLQESHSSLSLRQQALLHRESLYMHLSHTPLPAEQQHIQH